MIALRTEGGSGFGWVDTIPFVLLGEVLAVVFVIRVLGKGGSTAATLNWVVLILLAPWIGLLLYYLLPSRLSLHKLRRRTTKLAWIESSLDELAPPPGQVEGIHPLGRLLRSLDPESVAFGNRVQLVATGPRFFDQACAAIAAARRFVHFETYIFRPDQTGLALLEVLVAAARRGVEVRLLYDSFGSFSLKSRHLAALRAAGGKAYAYMPILWRRRPFTLNLRLHRKLLVVDGEVAFTGGRNVGDEYARDRFGKARIWWDTMVRIEGPAVPRLHRVFVEDWYNAVEEDLARREYFPEVGRVDDDVVGIVASGPDQRASHFHYVMVQLITMAERTIDLSSPYLIPNETMLTVLRIAAKRGVRVRVHINGPAAAQWILLRAGRYYSRQLLTDGVEVYETQGDYNHSKTVLVDGKTLFVGSHNLDIRSGELNFELGVLIDRGPACAAAARLFTERLAAGKRLDLAEIRRSSLAVFVENACRLLSPLL